MRKVKYLFLLLLLLHAFFIFVFHFLVLYFFFFFFRWQTALSPSFFSRLEKVRIFSSSLLSLPPSQYFQGKINCWASPPPSIQRGFFAGKKYSITLISIKFSKLFFSMGIREKIRKKFKIWNLRFYCTCASWERLNFLFSFAKNSKLLVKKKIPGCYARIPPAFPSFSPKKREVKWPITHDFFLRSQKKRKSRKRFKFLDRQAISSE